MAAEPKAVRAAVYIDSEKARELAEEALEPLAKDRGGSFSGVAEGWLEPAEVKRLNDAGLVVELLASDEPGATPDSEAPVPTGGAAQARSTQLIDDIKQQVSSVGFSEDQSRLELGVAFTEHDPRIHRFAVAAPGSSQAPAEDVYNIELRGPITRKQRLEFDELGVDIAAFESGFGYRAFLTREQHAAVQKLPFVAGLNRYSFEQALTPELLDVVSQDGGSGGEAKRPGLMSDAAQGEAQQQIFDCVLHREEDLPKIRELIDRSPETTIIGSSNLRVRFSADVHVPFIAALASLPEVRKLTPYKAPKI